MSNEKSEIKSIIIGDKEVAKVQGIAVDKDGTLIDTEEVKAAIFNDCIDEIASQHDEDFSDIRYKEGQNSKTAFTQWIGNGENEEVKMFRANIYEEFKEKYTNQYRQNLHEEMVSKIKYFEDAVCFLENLVSANIKRCLATSSPKSALDFEQEQFGILNYFQHFVTKDDVSRNGIIKSKPCPDIFRIAREKMELSPAVCCAVEDSRDGVESALADEYGYIILVNRKNDPQLTQLAKKHRNIYEVDALNEIEIT